MSSERRITLAVYLGLVAMVFGMTVIVVMSPRPETTAARSIHLLTVRMTYDEAKAVLGGDGFNAGTSEGETTYIFSFNDNSSLDVTFDADQRMTWAALPPKRRAGPWWDILTHMGY